MGGASGTKPEGIDPTVGGLVWVRRRNGSWWPGRIMGTNELSEDSLISHRLGTPVKLLGRDDASVDWYNLEKSRRVKAFRCGEYDECIAKAQTAASSSAKKAVKYARREDAILQALELENALLSRDCPDSNMEADISSDEKSNLKEVQTVSCSTEEIRNVKEEDNSSSALDLSQSAVSFEELNQANGAQRSRRTPNDSEEDGTEGVKRMRGLEDLGIGIVSSLKKKRSQVAHVQELFKRKNRRRPLNKVLESTSIVFVPVTSESQVLHNSDTTVASCDNEISLNASDHGSDIPLVQKEIEISSRLEVNLSDVSFVGEDKQTEGFDLENINMIQTMENGSSKWKLKRKRNSRQINKHERRESRNCMAIDETSFRFGWNRNANHKVSNSSLPVKRLKLIPNTLQPQRSLPYRHSRFTLNPKYQASDFPIRGFDTNSSLFDISLEAKTNHQPQHVPFISLMSKLNSRPIIGHPITVEPLKDGFCDDLLGCKPKKNGNLLKKTRKLSSLTGSQRRNQEEKKPMLEKLNARPVIACVPLKVVFSRINASFNSSIRPTSKPIN